MGNEQRMNELEFKLGATERLSLRISAATLCKVTFPHPADGQTMLALERTGTLARSRNRQKLRVIAKPFGGGVQLRDPGALRTIIGEFHFDSQRSRNERDFRILIEPSKWQALKGFCLQSIQSPGDDVLETSPDRELKEEFEEALKIELSAEQYRVKASGVVIEDKARMTDNVRAQGQPTVRIYQVFEVKILDPKLAQAILQNSRMVSDQDLAEQAMDDARQGGRGRANAALDEPVLLKGHLLDGNVLAVLEEIETRKYLRYPI